MDRNIETIVLSDEDSDMETLNDSSVLIVEETESTGESEHTLFIIKTL